MVLNPNANSFYLDAVFESAQLLMWFFQREPYTVIAVLFFLLVSIVGIYHVGKYVLLPVCRLVAFATKFIYFLFKSFCLYLLSLVKKRLTEKK